MWITPHVSFVAMAKAGIKIETCKEKGKKFEKVVEW